METHKAFAAYTSQYRQNTVIENHSNAKEILYGGDMEFKHERP